MRRRFVKIGVCVVAVLALLLAGTGWWVRNQLTGSLPQLDGEVIVEGIAAPVTVERDSLGIPTIRAANRRDLAFATGFVHAQDRFFQMDLLRRNSAGELSELVGAAALDHDRQVRVLQFRKAAKAVLADGSDQDRQLIEAYTAGVNAGLKSLRKKPFEYFLLGSEPAPWKPEDSALVMFSMYLDLQGNDFRDEVALGLLHDLLPGEMFAFLAPMGTEWDAPLVGEGFEVPPIPGPDVFDTRRKEQVAIGRLAPLDALPEIDHFCYGSNNWAVSGSQTADGRAIVADDMHLGIRVPHIWYRASFVWPDEDGDGQQRMTGVSLPGTPAIVVGSNGHVAWGFTNSEGDWCDVVIVEEDPDEEDSYKTPDGPRKFEHASETIKVKDGPDETVEITSTIWGPVMMRDHQDRPLAQRWVALDTAGVNMGLLRVESARTLEEAMRLANLSGSPAQNFVVASEDGRIGWTIVGRIPRRVGFDGRLPSSWADGMHRWDGYLEPEEYPKIVEPENGRIWTANARVAGGKDLEIIGDGGYDLGARQQQIRDDLLATENPTEADMLRIQLDDRAVFLERWQGLLLDTLTSDAVKADPRRGELRTRVENWGGRAAIDSVGFRAVRAFRRRLFSQLCDVLGSACKEHDKDFSLGRYERVEGAVWRLVSEKPAHLIDPRFEDWNALLLAAADAVIAEAEAGGRSLDDYTWGEANTTRIAHPLSRAVPSLSGWLDMPSQPLAGGWNDMPRIQAPTRGASERMAVSPGHESEGYMHMPCGQSGHPLSPHYRDSHAAWAEGKATPFLPGKAVNTLVLNAK